MDAELFRNLLYSLSGLSFGAAFYALVVHGLKLRQDFRLHIGLVLVKLAWLMVAGEVFKTIIIPITAIPPTGDAYVYGLGLACGAIGMVLVARRWK